MPNVTCPSNSSRWHFSLLPGLSYDVGFRLCPLASLLRPPCSRLILWIECTAVLLRRPFAKANTLSPELMASSCLRFPRSDLLSVFGVVEVNLGRPSCLNMSYLSLSHFPASEFESIAPLLSRVQALSSGSSHFSDGRVMHSEALTLSSSFCTTHCVPLTARKPLSKLSVLQFHSMLVSISLRSVLWLLFKCDRLFGTSIKYLREAIYWDSLFQFVVT